MPSDWYDAGIIGQSPRKPRRSIYRDVAAKIPSRRLGLQQLAPRGEKCHVQKAGWGGGAIVRQALELKKLGHSWEFYCIWRKPNNFISDLSHKYFILGGLQAQQQWVRVRSTPCGWAALLLSLMSFGSHHPMMILKRLAPLWRSWFQVCLPLAPALMRLGQANINQSNQGCYILKITKYLFKCVSYQSIFWNSV